MMQLPEQGEAPQQAPQQETYIPGSADSTMLGRFSTAEVRVNAEADMNFLGALALPEVCTVSFPDLYLGLWDLAMQALRSTRDFSKFAIGLPRGHAKTTVIKLLIVAIILFTKKRFVLIVGASEALAENILSDVCDILDSPNITGVFGNWRLGLETDRTGLKKFNFLGRSVILAALGSGTSLRGLNIKNARPDVIICDDMQTQDEAGSEAVAKKLMKWFVGTLMKVKNPWGCTYFYVGNMYPDMKVGGASSEVYTCILRNLQKNPSWISWIVGGILADGQALWEEVQPLKILLSELESDIAMGCPEVFFAEVQNDPTCGGSGLFDISKLPAYEINPDLDMVIGKFLMIDPSLGKKKSDSQVVGEFWVYEGTPHLMKLHIKQVSAPELVKWGLDYARKERIPLIVAESVAYQGTLLQWFEHFAAVDSIQGIHFRPISPGGRSKPSRIISYFKSLMAGRSKVHPNCLAQVLSQIQNYDPARIHNVDDILDVGAYGEDVCLQYALEYILPDIYCLDQTEYSGVEENNRMF